MTTKTIITNKQGNVFRSPPSYFKVSRFLSLPLADAPENVLTEEQVNADRGTKVTLKCSAEGNPTPKLTWSRKPPTPNR